MTACPGHTMLCGHTKPAGDNTRSCFLNKAHDGPHVCVCWHRWKDTP